ncbi:MAG: EF-Tu/IF-2/RF-3 family GTPase, partial [Candidatus Diapherotrites archaeon]|nr:EF-Tu/IF-2/RF-3 family GTPase [Candidatus Diapherotrites archaeon]
SGTRVDKNYTFKADPQVISLLGRHFDAISLANNHTGDFGHEALLEMVVEHLPDPVTAQKYRIPKIWKGEPDSEIGKSMITTNPKGELAMMVTDVTVSDYAGDIATGRVYSGSVRKGTKTKLIGGKKEAIIQSVGLFMGADFVEVDEIGAGNIVAMKGMREVYAGETVSTIDMDEFESFLSAVEPVITISIEPKQTKDLPKLIEAVKQLSKEDPNLRATINAETGEHLISGMGELHLEVNLYRITTNYKIPVNTTPPIVVFTETITKESPKVEGKTPNKHNKFLVTVEPIPQEILDKMTQTKFPKKIKPKDKVMVEKFVELGFDREESKKFWAVKNNCVLVDSTRGIEALFEVKELLIQGFEDAVDKGPLAKERCFGIKVNILDATLHEDAIHRGPSQVLPAIGRAIYAGIMLGNPVLYEPKQILTISVPEEYMGSVSKELGSRRTQILEIKQEGDLTIFVSKAPVKELIGFAADMRGATQGKAMWTAEYAGYELMPRELQGATIREIRTRKGMEPEPKPAAHYLD